MSTDQAAPSHEQETAIEGLRIFRMTQISDDRGTIRIFYRESAFRDSGAPQLAPWAQINVTETGHGAIRGLHGEQMNKLVAVVEGEAFGAYLDARPDSPTRGRTVTVRLTKGTQVFVPAGVCNGFQSVSPGGTQYLYCFDREWAPGMPGVSVNPLDPALGIPWPIDIDPSDPSLLSAKDAALPLFAELS